MGGTLALDPLLKNLIQRPAIDAEPGDYSFPSGSAMISLAVVIALVLTVPASSRALAVSSSAPRCGVRRLRGRRQLALPLRHRCRMVRRRRLGRRDVDRRPADRLLAASLDPPSRHGELNAFPVCVERDRTVVRSITSPGAHEVSSSFVAGPQTASIRSASGVTSTRTCSRCMARYAVRESMPDHGGSSSEPPPEAVMCTTWLIGRYRS